jgi:hypothetical protein
MPKKGSPPKPSVKPAADAKKAAVAALLSAPTGKPSALVDTRVIYCGDNLEQLAKLPDACVDLIYIDPPFNSNRNYEVFWGETKEKRAFEDRHASTQAYIDYMRPAASNSPASSRKPAPSATYPAPKRQIFVDFARAHRLNGVHCYSRATPNRRLP